MSDDPNTILTNPLTGEVVEKLPEIDMEPVPGSGALPDDVKNSEVPEALRNNVGTDTDLTDPGQADPVED